MRIPEPHIRADDAFDVLDLARLRWDASAGDELLARPVRKTATNESGAVKYEGFIRVEGPLRYKEDGKDVVELVTRKAIEDTVAALQDGGLPVVLGIPRRKGQLLGHPKVGDRLVLITPKNWKKYQVGMVDSAELVELPDGRAAAKVAIWVQDADAQDYIENRGANQLSPLYEPVVVDEVGTLPDGTAYQRKQVGAKSFNNVIFTDAGRAGETCSVRVDAVDDPEETAMPTLGEMDLQAFLEGLWAFLAPKIAEAVKSAMTPAEGEVAAVRSDAVDEELVKAVSGAVVKAMEEASTDKWAKSLMNDDYTRAIAKAVVALIDEGKAKPPGAEREASESAEAADAADPGAAMKAKSAELEKLQADMAALQSRYDALNGEKLKADAADLDAALKAQKVECKAFDPKSPTEAGITAGRLALADAVVGRSRAGGVRADDRFTATGPEPKPRPTPAEGDGGGAIVPNNRFGG